MAEHAKLAPSAAKRWMTCPGSVEAEALVLKQDGEPRQNDAAALGTALHEIAEEMLMDPSIEYEDIAGTVYNGIEINDIEMVEERIDGYLTECRYYTENDNFDCYIEHKVHISEICWGTADFIACDGELLVVNDLKTGTGVRVDARQNPQLMLYALGAYYDMRIIYPDIERVRLMISQPALNNMDIEDYVVRDLLDFERNVLLAFELILSENPPLIASEEGCQWCLARSTCPQMRALVEHQAAEDFEHMTAQQLADALDNIPLIKMWIKGVEDRAKERVLNGKSVPGYKVVGGRRTRRWKDQEAAMRYIQARVRKFKAHFIKESFVSPAQAEKILRKVDCHREVDLASQMEWHEGNPTLAVLDDPREEIETGDRAARDFADVSEAN